LTSWNRQGVEVGADPDRLAAVADGHRGDNSMLADAGFHIVAPLADGVGDVLRGVRFLHRELGVAMHVLEPLGHLGCWFREP